VVPAVFNKAGQHHSEVFVTTASKAGDVTNIADAMAETCHTTCTSLGYKLVYSKRLPERFERAASGFGGGGTAGGGTGGGDDGGTEAINATA